MTGIDGTVDPIFAGLDELTEAMVAASNAGVLAVVAFSRERLKQTLSGSSNAGRPGQPPGEQSGKLAGSVTSITLPSPTGIAVWTGTTEFYGSFLNSGWHPNGSRRRRSDRERRTLQRTSKGAGEVRYPYIDDVFEAALAESAVVAADIRLL